MKRIWCLAVVLVALAVPAAATEEMVTFPSGSEPGSGFLVTPEGRGPFAAVIVIQEWWGVTDWVKDQARALAREGYMALAVDLYHGKVATRQEDAHQYMMGMPRDRAIRDLRSAAVYLKRRTDVQPHKIGAIGWCMGGMYSLALATYDPTLAAVVAYYGTPPTEAAELERIRAPILGHFGGKDEGPSPAQVRQFEAAMKKAKKSIEVKIYPGAGHAFANPKNPWGGYREAAAKEAWMRTLAFFDKNLKH
jgi:carboxymethylenebutenolidase